MGIFKEIYDIVKDFFSGTIKKKKFRKLIDNMIIAIETETVTDYFFYKYKKLEHIALSINLNEKSEKNYLDKYLRVKRFYKTHCLKSN